MVKAQVLEVDVERERISLGIKQVSGEGAGAGEGSAESAAAGEYRKGQVVTAIVREARDGGIEVQIGEDGPTAFIKRSDLSRDRDEQRPERFQIGQKVDAQVIGFERGKKPMLSIKAMQISEEKQQVAQYGSSDSGASLGDILGAALNKAKQDG
jgi:small subunit ribosomal protein S1